MLLKKQQPQPPPTNTNVSIDVCTTSETEAGVCHKMSAVESQMPALFVIGGKLESGPMVNDVFASK